MSSNTPYLPGGIFASESQRLTALRNSVGPGPSAGPQKMNPIPPNSIVSVPATSFYLAGKELLETGKYADAKIIANGKTYDVHKSVLCTRSKWFRKALEGAFREGREGVVEISAPDNIDRLLEFLYTGAVDLTNTNGTDLMAATNELSVLGDFYQTDEMNTYATEVLGRYLGELLNLTCDFERWSTKPPQYSAQEYQRPLIHYNTSTGIHRHRNFELLEEQGFIESLCKAIRSAYDTPSGIHRVYVDFVYAARTHTFRNSSIQELKDEIPEFGLDILSALMTGPLSSAFQGNKAFEQWKDGLANHEAITSMRQTAPQPGQQTSVITTPAAHQNQWWLPP